MPQTGAISTTLKKSADAGDVPGVIAMAADASGVFFEGAFGKRSLSSDVLMTADTVVRIASMTKAVTAVCAMQLVEQEKLSLDEPVGTLLPDLASVQVFEGFDDSGQPRMRAPKRPITLRHLLTHTSGHVYDTWNAKITPYRDWAGIPPTDSGLNAALRTPLLFDPGENWEYSISIDWVGKAVEAVSGMTLGRYMTMNVFDPLGMKDSGFTVGESQHARRADIHARNDSGKLEVFDRKFPQKPEFEAGGGGLSSTVSDYIKFTQMILHKGTFNGVRLLKPETVALMSQNAIGPTNVRALKTAQPHRSRDVDFISGMKWGLSFLINPEPLPTGRSANSLAWAGLMNSYYWIDPVKMVTGVMATQILPFCDVKALPLFWEFEREVYKAIGR
jgi:CubicO group peptidase (beta-lactamase class C family)